MWRLGEEGVRAHLRELPLVVLASALGARVAPPYPEMVEIRVASASM